tara:strand:- start:1334 stop:1684 length:351 start_codon:yes stop_codon:yes gene_type:complete
MEQKIIQTITELMLEKKASDIKIINVKKLTSITDYFINCSSDSDPQTKAIKNNVQKGVSKKYQIKPVHIEGHENLKWVLMDYINIVINIFHKKEREFYNIERLWADADIKEIKGEK